MRRTVYTPEQVDFLRAGFKAMRIPELTIAFNAEFQTDRSGSQLRAAIKNRKITCGRKPGLRKGERSLLFTGDQVQFIKNNCSGLSRKDLAAAVNETFGLQITNCQIKAFITNHKIKSGRTGFFEKGFKPWNTGTKGLVKPNSGSFKKGQVPVNFKPLGYERICSKDGYILIKVAETNPWTGAPTRYRPKHIVVWEAANGPVPAGHIVCFVDGSDKENCDLDNLEMLSRREQVRLNQLGYSKVPVELKPVIKTLAHIAMKRGELEKGLSG